MFNKYKIVRNEAGEYTEGGGGSDPLGLGLDLSGVDTSRPALPEGMYVLGVKDVKREANKAQTGFNLVILFETTSDSTDVTGDKNIAPGFIVRKYYPLQQSDNAKAPDFKADLARLQDAIEGTEQGNRPPFNPFNYVGRQVMAKLKVETSDDYGTQNNISKLEPISE